MNGGTPRELGPIADSVLAWVARQRSQGFGVPHPHLRRIELCALATREATMFFDLYGLEPPEAALEASHATTPDLQGQRLSAGGVPEAPQGRQGGTPPGCLQ